MSVGEKCNRKETYKQMFAAAFSQYPQTENNPYILQQVNG